MLNNKLLRLVKKAYRNISASTLRWFCSPGGQQLLHRLDSEAAANAAANAWKQNIRPDLLSRYNAIRKSMEFRKQKTLADLQSQIGRKNVVLKGYDNSGQLEAYKANISKTLLPQELFDLDLL